MYDPSINARHRRTPEPISWRAVLAGVVASAAVPVVLWAVSQPLAGTVVMTLAVGLLVGATHRATVTRDFRDHR